MRNQYNPKFKAFEDAAVKMLEKYGEEYDSFVFGYQAIEMYDANGESFQQLTPYFKIQR